jgi:hypothetical protein
MCRCSLCGPISRNEADFDITFGREDRSLQICRWCVQDLVLFGFKSNQIVGLHHDPKKRSLEFILGRAFSPSIATQSSSLATVKTAHFMLEQSCIHVKTMTVTAGGQHK